MPGGDRTGPFGAGAMTGRGMGFCAGYSMPGYLNPYGGMRFGRGGGRGNRWMYYATGLPGWARTYNYPAPNYGVPFGQFAGVSERDELRYLKNQAKYFNEMLSDISRRIEELGQSKEDKI